MLGCIPYCCDQSELTRTNSRIKGKHEKRKCMCKLTEMIPAGRRKRSRRKGDRIKRSSIFSTGQLHRRTSINRSLLWMSHQRSRNVFRAPAAPPPPSPHGGKQTRRYLVLPITIFPQFLSVCFLNLGCLHGSAARPPTPTPPLPVSPSQSIVTLGG